MLWRYEHQETEEIKNKDYKYYLLVVFFLILFVLVTWFITANINLDYLIWIMIILHCIIFFTTINSVFSVASNLSTLSNYKCADVYCINLDTYSKLDVPTDPIRVKLQDCVCLVKFIIVSKVNVDLDVLQILEIDDVKFTVSFSMYFGVRSGEIFSWIFNHFRTFYGASLLWRALI